MCNLKNHKGRLTSHLVMYLSRMGSQFHHVLLHPRFGRFSKQREKSNRTLSVQSASARTKTRNLSAAGILVFTMLIAACGTEDSTNTDFSTPINRTLTGTVAVGLPVKGAITIIDTDGKTLDAQSNTNGTYTANLGGRPGPYLIRVEPDDNNFPVLYSYATSSGVANITPFTTLALFLAYQSDFADSFDSWATIHAGWKRADFEQARSTINANFSTELQNAGVNPVAYDFFTVPFEANQTGIDAFLDNYSVSFDYGAGTYNITDNSGQPVIFNENIDTANYYIGASFLPEDAANWKLTWTPQFDGQQGTPIVSYPGNNIPWSEERFNEIFWENLASIPSQVTICKESPTVSCNISVQVTQLDTNYDVIGNGEIGTIVTGGGTYNWNMSGWYQPDGQPRQTIEKSTSWSFSWSWERIS